MLPLALTMGDPAGIGGELTLRAWLACRETATRFVALDDPAHLARLARSLGLQIPIRETNAFEAEDFAHALPVLPVRLATPAIPGQANQANAPSVIASIAQATKRALSGQAAGVVTNPIHKSTLTGTGFPHPGHTEFLAELTGAPMPVMMLASPLLRVVPVTIRLPLKRAIETLTTDLIVQTARITLAALRRDWAIPAPRLALCGLNPHAGEAGTMGTEDQAIIAPAIATLRAEGHHVTGPHPADSLFTPAARQTYDAALGMYHDQALIPIKTLDMANGVNVTLGLPIIRTSPDHGTAFDIAGKGLADPTSLLAAIHLAATLAAKRKPAP